MLTIHVSIAEYLVHSGLNISHLFNEKVIKKDPIFCIMLFQI